MSFDEALLLPSPTGASLRLYRSFAERPRAVVQVNHGLAEHAGRYARFASFLAAHGFHTYAHDHRGHGHTTAQDAPRGTFGPEPAADKVIEDVLAVHDRIAADHPGLPVVIFGHSMGAMIALVFLMRHAARIRAAAIWNAPLASGLEARAGKAVLAWERFRLGSDVPSRLMPRLTFAAWAKAVPDARTPFDWLSRDAGEVEKYVADPLCGWDPMIAMWRTLFDFNLEIAGGGLDKVPKGMPIQLVGGSGDPSTRGGRIMRGLEMRLSREGFSNLETMVYDGARHETLNETNREEAMADFASWAEMTLG